MSPLILDSGYSERARRRQQFAIASAKVQDVRRLVDIEFHAFENERVNQVLSYRDYKKPAHFERSVKLYQKALLGDHLARTNQGTKRRRSGVEVVVPQAPSSSVSFKKVVDMESNEIVSFTKYEMKQYNGAELRSAADSGHEGEQKMNRDWFALNERLRREYIGMAAHCCKSSK
jgi:hypothetical protein